MIPPYLPILAVDDEEMILNLLVSVVEDLQLSIRTARSCQEAQELFEQHRFGLVLTDILMPESTGLDLCLWIRRKNPHIPIIAMSGNLRPVDAYRLEELSVRVFAKPLRLSTLESLLAKIYKIPTVCSNS